MQATPDTHKKETPVTIDNIMTSYKILADQLRKVLPPTQFSQNTTDRLQESMWWAEAALRRVPAKLETKIVK